MKDLEKHLTCKYVIGESPVPLWAKTRLQPYRKVDGSTGFDFHGYLVTFDLSVGDVLIMHDGRIDIKRK